MSTPTGSATPAQLQAAQQAWVAVADGGPYTALKMFEYILTQDPRKGGITDFEALVAKFFNGKDPSRLKGITRAVIGPQNINAGALASTWNSSTGRCTSFAAKAVTELEARRNLNFNFAYFDLEGHRIARCENTRIIIDSSSAKARGAFVLPDNVWETFEGTEGKWKYEKGEGGSGKSKFVTEPGHPQRGKVKIASEKIDKKEAMALCLEGIESAAPFTLPTLFRSVDAQGFVRFHGMVAWAPNKHALDLVRDLGQKNQKWTIQWATTKKVKEGKGMKDTGVLDPALQGTPETLAACMTKLAEFIQAYGGPHWQAQWQADGIGAICLRMIDAACDVWGNPKLVDATGVGAASTSAAAGKPAARTVAAPSTAGGAKPAAGGKPGAGVQRK